MSERIDDTGFGGIRIIQDTDAFCYGIDAVLLADFAACRTSDRVIDLGTGNGIVPLILTAKYSPSHITGLELQPSMHSLAVRNSELNGLEDRVDFVCGDVNDIKDYFSAGCADAVTCNPPYTEKGRGPSFDSVKQTARHETTAGLESFISAAEYLLKKGGSLFMVHRPSRLVDIISMCRAAGLEPKQLRLVAPHEDEAANIVLIQAVKGAGHELKVLPQLVVRKKDGSYTAALEEIYRD